MPKENMKQFRLGVLQHAYERFGFASGNLPWRSANLLEPESSQEMESWSPNHRKFVEWIAADLFSLPSNHDGHYSRERNNLPVNVQHLRFQECRTITGHHRPFCLRWRTVRSFRQNRNSKNLIPLHLAGSS